MSHVNVNFIIGKEHFFDEQSLLLCTRIIMSQREIKYIKYQTVSSYYLVYLYLDLSGNDCVLLTI